MEKRTRYKDDKTTYMREYMQNYNQINPKKVYCDICNCYTSFVNIYRHNKSKKHLELLKLNPIQLKKFHEDILNKQKIRAIKKQIKYLKNEIKQYQN